MVLMLETGPPRIRRRSLIGRIMIMHIVLAVGLNPVPFLLFPLYSFFSFLGRFRRAWQVRGHEQLLFLVFFLVFLCKFSRHGPGFSIRWKRRNSM